VGAIDDPHVAGDLSRPRPLAIAPLAPPIPRLADDAAGVEQQLGEEAQHARSMRLSMASAVEAV
jgi:hypothetical protein